MSKHPSNRGLVLLAAWVEPGLRDLVRARAAEAGVPFSEYVAEALRKQGVKQDVVRLFAKNKEEK